MPKIRVHEFAKELGVDKKEISEYLTEKGYKDITAVSNVPDHEVEILRQKYGKSTAPAEKKDHDVEPVKENAESKSGNSEEDKPKKKKIIRVFRSQNATTELQQRRPKKAAPAPEKEKAVKEKVEETVKKEPVKAEEIKTEEKKAEPEKKEVAQVENVKAEPKKAEAVPKEAVKVEKAPVEKKESEVKKVEEPKKEEVKTEHAQTENKVQKPAQSQTAPQMREKAPAQNNNGRRDGDNGQRQDRRSSNNNARTNDGRTPRDNRNQSQGNRRDGQNRPAFNRDNNQNRNGRPSNGRPMGNRDGQSRPPYNKDGFNKDGQGSRRPGQRNDGQGNGRSFGDRPRNNQRPVAAAPAEPLASKTTRDYRDKHKDKERDERRNNQESRFGGGRRDGRQFNRVPKALQNQKPKEQETKKVEKITEITIPERLTIRELADAMGINPSLIIKNLFMKGEMVTVNHEVTFEKAQEIAMEFDVIAEQEEKEDVIGALLAEEDEDESTMVSRPPVVCVMGHVDHGKTSLLDAIRDTHVTDREAGGITQHIGAYMVSAKGQKITFLDTPGHEAFTAMRMRGANSTDIAVLVVAADDGIMPQTIEAINHAKAAEVEIIVAINKIDKPGANIERVKQELTEYGLIAEDWGGSTIVCPVSAKTHEGIDDLLDMILLTAEVMELKANPKRLARGLVLEAKLDKGRGPVATILVQKGTLRQGDFIACGAASGKVRAMNDEKGRMLKKATPSMPVEIIGLNAVPEAGEVLVALKTDKEAKDFAATFINEGKKNLLEETRHQMSLNDLFEQIQEGNLKELPLIVKADVQGSVEAVKQSLLKLSNDEIVVKVIHGAVGTITESDVTLASASNAIIIGFNVRIDAQAKASADQEHVEVKLYNVIYQAIEDVERAIKGMRAAVYEERVTATLEIRQMFKASGVGNIAGAYVKKGTVERGSQCRIFHDGEKIYEGKLKSLKRFKDDVKEVKEGFECGLVFEDFNDFNEEDTVECFKMVEVEQD